MRTYFVVRAVIVDPADRAPFDHWYQSEHLPDAMRIFGAAHAFLGGLLAMATFAIVYGAVTVALGVPEARAVMNRVLRR